MTSWRGVLIGGCDRSGTTMLGAMLGAAPDVVCLPESQFIWDLARSRRLGKSALDYLHRSHRFSLWGLSLDGGLGDAVAECDDLSELLALLRTFYARAVGKDGATIWIDHTPLNARYLRSWQDISPGSKLIHIVRDGRAVANSVTPLSWGPATYTEAGHWWVERVAHGLAAELCFGAATVLRIRYEDLLSSPARTLRRICSFTAVPYTSSMTDVGGYKLPAYTRDQHNLVGRPVDPTRADAWRTRLAKRDIELFESACGDMLAYLGYEPVFGACAQPRTRRECLRDRTWSFTRRQFIDRYRERSRRRIQSRVDWRS